MNIRIRLLTFSFLAITAISTFGVQTAHAQSAAERCEKESGDAAIAACSEAIRRNPKNAALYLNRGVEWRKKGDKDKAIADYSEAIRLKPEYALAYNNRGNAWFAQGDYDKAIADYSAAIRRNPKYVTAYYNRGNALDEKGDYDKAIVDFNEAIRLNPKYAVAYNNRGIAWRKKGEYDKAIADYNEAISLNPSDATAYNNRGFAWRQKGDYDKAIADHSEAIRLDSKYSIAYNNRGVALDDKGDYDKALADYNEAIRLDPKYVNAYSNRGYTWRNKRDYDKAIADYNEALKLDPNHKLAKTNLKNALEERAKEQRTTAQAQQQQAPVQRAPQQTPIATVPIGKRVALIIGNAKYIYSPALENPTRDAQLLASTLRNVGFQSVSVKTDLTREGMMQALREFAQTADNSEWAVVYYSGHGIEFGGANYMIPVDAQLRADRDIDLETVNVGQVMNTIEGATRLRLVVLDACRDNPFASQMRRTMATRSIGKGLARIEPEAGTLVVYAAKHGEVALDGSGKNSPFVEALVSRMQQRPPLEIRRLFDFVRDDVLESTRKKQQPFSYGSLSAREEFFFVK